MWSDATLGFDKNCAYHASGSTVPDETLSTDVDPFVLRLGGITLCTVTEIKAFEYRNLQQEENDGPASGSANPGRESKIGRGMVNAFEAIFDPVGKTQTWTPSASTLHTPNEITLRMAMASHADPPTIPIAK
jgi:hypothetical protein